MSLIVFPAIDLKGGQVVRLAEGDMARATVYGDDPAAQARAFAEAGADHLHVVDLDGAFAGQAVNGGAVEAIVAAFPGKVQVGGGIRDRAGIDRWLALGVDRVVHRHRRARESRSGEGGGARPARPHRRRRRCARRLRRDARLGRGVRRRRSPISPRASPMPGVAALLFTDVGRDGLLKGCNVEATLALARQTTHPGDRQRRGRRTSTTSSQLARHAADGIEGVITGRALYEGRSTWRRAAHRAGADASPIPERVEETAKPRRSRSSTRTKR